VSGDVRIIDKAMPHLAKGGEIVLAGFYAEPLSFAFAPAFMREASVRAAAEWQRPDMLAVKQLAEDGRLNLSGLITHRERAEHAAGAYRTAFNDAGCLKMVLDWKGCQ
jgi:bacteriochlorophyllide a dehydrogenase